MTNAELELIGLDTLNLSQLVWYSPTCNAGDEVDESLLPSAVKKIRLQTRSQQPVNTPGVVFLNPRV